MNDLIMIGKCGLAKQIETHFQISLNFLIYEGIRCCKHKKNDSIEVMGDECLGLKPPALLNSIKC